MEKSAEAEKDKKREKLFKILVVGNTRVGKTSVVQRYCDDVFSAIYVPTTGVDFKLCDTSSLGAKLKVEIWDVEGKCRSSRAIVASVEKYIRAATGILFVYSVTNKASFVDIEEWMRLAEKYTRPDTERFLLGNKCDLEKDRVISKKEGECFALENQMRFFETCASCDTHPDIKNAFSMMISDIRMHHDEEYAKSFEMTVEEQPVEDESHCMQTCWSSCVSTIMRCAACFRQREGKTREGIV